MENKRWDVFPQLDINEINQYPEINPIILQLLFNRGIKNPEEIKSFLQPDYDTDLGDPFIFKDMTKAVERIFLARDRGEKVLIWGDYDADGVTSTALLSTVFKKLKLDFEIFIPLRDEGYGMNLPRLKEYIQKGIQLIVTVDCGSSDQTVISKAKQAGLEVIITDHHEEPVNLPTDALAIINPSFKRENYPFRELAGVGVTFKLAQALIRKASLGEAFEKWLLDLVAIGTIADIMPIIGENRTLVTYGLVVLRKTPRVGIKALVKEMGSKLADLQEWQIAWQLGPRLNASGRIDNAIISYELLMTEDPLRAEELVSQVAAINKERQNMTEIMSQEISKNIETVNDLEKQAVLFAYDPTWPAGLLGLVAGKLKEKYYKPFFVMTNDGDKVKGSGRSIEGINLVDSLKAVEYLFEAYGGHEAACGFTLKSDYSFTDFKDKISPVIKEQEKNLDTAPTIKIDAEITLEEVNWELFETLEDFGPYGEANWQPKFVLRNLTLENHETMGKDKQHVRLMVSQDKPEVMKVVAFGWAERFQDLSENDKIDLIFELSVNEWNGNRELQLRLVDLKKLE